MTEAQRELDSLIDDVEVAAGEIGEELRNIERIRTTKWIETDLPPALDHLIELTWAFKRDAKRLAKILRQLLPDVDADDEDDD